MFVLLVRFQMHSLGMSRSGMLLFARAVCVAFLSLLVPAFAFASARAFACRSVRLSGLRLCMCVLLCSCRVILHLRIETWHTEHSII